MKTSGMIKEVNLFKTLGLTLCLISGFICILVFGTDAKASEKENSIRSNLFGHITYFQGQYYASPNWYADMSKVSKHLETLLLEFPGEAAFELQGENLFLNIKNQNSLIYMGKIDGAILRDMKEGQRVSVESKDELQFKLIARTSRPSMSLNFGCGITGCGSNPNIDLKRSYLIEITNVQKEVICLNRGFQKNRSKVYSGACSK